MLSYPSAHRGRVQPKCTVHGMNPIWTKKKSIEKNDFADLFQQRGLVNPRPGFGPDSYESGRNRT